MTDTEALKAWIEAHGIKFRAIAQALNVSEFTLRQKIKGEAEFKVSQIAEFCRFTGMTTADRDRIFFGDYVE